MDDDVADIHAFPETRTRVKKLRLLFVLFGLSMLALVSTVFGMMMAVAGDLPRLENEAQYRAAKNSEGFDSEGRAETGRGACPAGVDRRSFCIRSQSARSPLRLSVAKC